MWVDYFGNQQWSATMSDNVYKGTPGRRFCFGCGRLTRASFGAAEARRETVICNRCRKQPITLKLIKEEVEEQQNMTWTKGPVFTTKPNGDASARVQMVYDSPKPARVAVGKAVTPRLSNDPTPAIDTAPDTLPGARAVSNILKTGAKPVVASAVQTKPASATQRVFKQAPGNTANLFGAKGAGTGVPKVPNTVKNVPLYGNRNIGQSARTVKRAIVGQPRASQFSSGVAPKTKAGKEPINL